jgi:hypothetical protein
MATPAEIGVKALATLAAQAERRRQASTALRHEIRSLMTAHSGPERLTAKRICKLLGSRCPTPSVRTIQDHMREIKRDIAGPAFLSVGLPRRVSQDETHGDSNHFIDGFSAPVLVQHRRD